MRWKLTERERAFQKETFLSRSFWLLVVVVSESKTPEREKLLIKKDTWGYYFWPGGDIFLPFALLG